MFQSVLEVFGYYNVSNTVMHIDCVSVATAGAETEIQLRDYQQEAYDCVLRDLQRVRSSLVVLATGLGKTILFSKIIQNWKGRVLVLVHLEELLQNAYQEIESITGEVLGIERGSEHHLGERIVVGTIQTVSLRLDKFSPEHFNLIIIDEAHHSASNIYARILEYFSSSKVVGLTATDQRADGKGLPFDTCSYRMGIKEGICEGYLVPIRGRRVIIDSVNLTRVKQTSTGDFDDQALDDEMVKGASAIADVIYNDYPFDKGILFFPGCASAKLTSEFLNKKSDGLSVYIDGKITGNIRRNLVEKLRSGESNWLCNVGIATEGFNWPEASVIGMCAPTLSRSAYVQRAGRGTRPLASLLNGLLTADGRKDAIQTSSKPYMTVLDFVGISANLNLISSESFLDPEPNEEKSIKVDRERQEDDSERDESEPESGVETGFRYSRIASGIQSTTVHSSEDFDPFEATGQEETLVKLKSKHFPTDPLSDKQYNLLKRNGIDDPTLTRHLAQICVKFIAERGFRLNGSERSILKKLHKEITFGTAKD